VILEDTATPPSQEPVEVAPPRSRFRELLAQRRVAIPLFVFAFAIYWYFVGLPTDPMLAALWLWLGTIAWSSDKPWRHHLGFLRDWLPIVVVLVAYDYSRGLADNGIAPHVTEMIRADEWLFGGALPSVWAQEHLYNPHHIYWYDVLASWVYFSHFVVSLTILAVLWFRNRPQWARFLRRWFTLTAAGLVTYFLYPAAPPWWASEHGYIAEHIVRMSSRGWSAIGLHSGTKLLSIGQALSNPVAAMPSLHSAFAMSAAVFFIPRVRKRWVPLLLAYPILMSVTLVYTGEHYIADALVGYAYVGAVYLVVGVAERWWAGWHGRRAAQPDEAGPPQEAALPQEAGASPAAEPGVHPDGASAGASGSASARASAE
jgi:hypothetical protein